DDTIVFPQLSQDEIIQIVDLMIAKLDDRLKDKDMGIVLTPAAKVYVATKGYDPVLGARPLRRTIQRDIEDNLSEQILYGHLKAGQIVAVDVVEDSEGQHLTFEGAMKSGLPDTPPVETASAVPPTEPAAAGEEG
ncbi:MAG TPA: NDP-hexose 4-ketoreductase, partial [Kineosporiaceae bacterium]|nr:NDP-hexose 4-ketoreductase [Kineosporiaceae bacterium]